MGSILGFLSIFTIFIGIGVALYKSARLVSSKLLRFFEHFINYRKEK